MVTKFEAGDRVKIKDAGLSRPFRATPEDVAIFKHIDPDNSDYIYIEWITETAQNDGEYEPCDFERIEAREWDDEHNNQQ